MIGNELIQRGNRTFELGDDAGMTFGPAKIHWQTDDANANVLAVILPEGGSVDVPVLVIGDATAEKDLAAHNGVTEPTIAIWNDPADAYVSLDAGDDAVAGSKGLYFNAAADEDIELINLSVTGTPRVFWDESENAISFPGITVADNLIKTTNLALKEETSNILALRNAADSSYKEFKIEGMWANTFTGLSDAAIIQAKNTDGNYLIFKARDTGNTAIEIGRLVGAADPFMCFTGILATTPTTSTLPTGFRTIGYASGGAATLYVNDAGSIKTASLGTPS